MVAGTHTEPRTKLVSADGTQKATLSKTAAYRPSSNLLFSAASYMSVGGLVDRVAVAWPG